MNFTKISASVRLFVLGLALVGGSASAARADDTAGGQHLARSQSQQAQTFQVRGVDPQQGAYTGQVTITQQPDGRVEVQRDVLFQSGQRQQLRGVGSQRGQEIRAQLGPVTEGLSGQLADAGQAEAPVLARITAQLDAQGASVQARVATAQGVAIEQGQIVSAQLPATGQIAPSVDQTLPVTGQIAPSVGQTLPATGQSAASVGQTLPALGEAQTLPVTGQIAPSVGQTLPVTGQTLPALGEAQILPATGQIAPSVGQILPATGQSAASVGQTLPALGEAQTLPATGQLAPSAGQDLSQQAPAPSALPPR